MQGRLAAGVTVEDSLASLKVAGERIWQRAVAVAEPDELTPLVRSAGRILAYVSVIADIAGSHASDLDTSLLRVERASRTLLDSVAGGSPRSAETQRIARALGFPLSDRYRVFAVAGPDSGPTRDSIAAELRRRGVLAVVQRDHVVGLAPEAIAHRVFPDTAVVALSEPVGNAELRSTIEHMHELAIVALRSGRTGVVMTDDLVTERLLASNPALSRIVHAEVFDPLAADESGRVDLVETLLTHVACDFDLARTAEALHLQRSSLRYRLDRISELTGKRFDRVLDLTVFALAAKANRLAADEHHVESPITRLVRGTKKAPALPAGDDDSRRPT